MAKVGLGHSTRGIQQDKCDKKFTCKIQWKKMYITKRKVDLFLEVLGGLEKGRWGSKAVRQPFTWSWCTW